MHAPKSEKQADLLPAELLLSAYRGGLFPMADSRDDHDLFWVEPNHRAVFQLDSFQPSRSLAKVVRQDRFTVTCNRDFGAVIRACAGARRDDPGDDAETWISHRIEASYMALHQAGHAHSIECWGDGKLLGGLYGVSFGRVFCGESMFSRADNASKVALVWLIALMRKAGYGVLDCQFMTDHLQTLGAVEISRTRYLALVDQACADGFTADLPAAWAQFSGVAAAGSAAVADGDATGSAGSELAGAAEAAGAATASSSPGKRIAQSFIQTS